jgi:putative hemolysin
MAMQEEKFIDLEKIIRDKNPRLAAFMPRFTLRYIRRIIHEKEVNAFIAMHGYKKGVAFAEAVLQQFGMRVVAKGMEHIPARGGFILAANHPLGGMDAMALFKILSTRRKDMKFIVNDILLRLENLSELFIGVNKHGRNAQRDLEAINNLYASGQAVLIFPAGLVSRKQKGQVRDLEWKKSFITQACRHKRTVVPVHISGRLTDRFYRLAAIRKAIGIKANIEMFYLVDEMFRQQGQTIQITIKKPVPYSAFDKSKNDRAWAQWVRERVYEGMN